MTAPWWRLILAACFGLAQASEKISIRYDMNDTVLVEYEEQTYMFERVAPPEGLLLAMRGGQLNHTFTGIDSSGTNFFYCSHGAFLREGLLVLGHRSLPFNVSDEQMTEDGREVHITASVSMSVNGTVEGVMSEDKEYVLLDDDDVDIELPVKVDNETGEALDPSLAYDFRSAAVRDDQHRKHPWERMDKMDDPEWAVHEHHEEVRRKHKRKPWSRLPFNMDPWAKGAPKPPRKPSPRFRRQADAMKTQTIELAVIADQGMWDLYTRRYGADAETALMGFLEAMIDTAQLLWRIGSISPKLAFKVSRLEVWKTQPAAVPSAVGGDVIQFLEKACQYFRPKANGMDHVAFISGLDLTTGDPPNLVGGLAYTGTICSDASCSLINAGVSGFRAGFTLAHEIGHSLSMKHDGDPNFAATADCNDRCCIMTRYGAGGTFGRGTTALWSTCSKTRYHEKLTSLEAASQNCLNNPVSTFRTVDILPGQANPEELQCHARLGTCARANPLGDINNCGELTCTTNNGDTSTAYFMVRPDGSYCGPDKYCEMGECVDSPTPLGAVDGGWGPWRQNTDAQCGDVDGCSQCRIQGQTRIFLDVRMCSEPPPQNGGSPCMGFSVRGRLCQGEAVCAGQTRDAFEEESCSSTTPGAVTSAAQRTACTFRCETAAGNLINRLNVPDGTPCTDGAGAGGLCVYGQCLKPECSGAPDYFVGTTLSCPGPVDCEMGAWSAWSPCPVSCGGGASLRTRSVAAPALYGGAECPANLEETQQCNVDACPSCKRVASHYDFYS